MPGHGEKLGRKQEVAIAALLTESTHSAAARAAGISEGTLRKWLKFPAFANAYREARRQLVDLAVSRIQKLTAGAVDTLRELLASTNDLCRLGAAKAILEYSHQGIEKADLVRRIEDLERALLERDAHHEPDAHQAA